MGYPILINTQRVPLIMDHKLYSDTHPIVSHSTSSDIWEFKTRSMDDIITIFGFTMYVCIYIINICIYMYHYIYPKSPKAGSCLHSKCTSLSILPCLPHLLQRKRQSSCGQRRTLCGLKRVGKCSWVNGEIGGICICFTAPGYILYIHMQLVYMDILRLNRMLIRIDNMMGVSEIGVYSLWPVEYAKQ